MPAFFVLWIEALSTIKVREDVVFLLICLVNAIISIKYSPVTDSCKHAVTKCPVDNKAPMILTRLERNRCDLMNLSLLSMHSDYQG